MDNKILRLITSDERIKEKFSVDKLFERICKYSSREFNLHEDSYKKNYEAFYNRIESNY